MAAAKKTTTKTTAKAPTVAELAKRVDALEVQLEQHSKAGLDMGAVEDKIKDYLKDAKVGERYNAAFEKVGFLNKAQQWVAGNPHYAIGIIIVLAILWLVF